MLDAGPAAKDGLPFSRLGSLHILPGAVQMGVYAALAPLLVRPRTKLAEPTQCQVVGNREPLHVGWSLALCAPLFPIEFDLLFSTTPISRILAEYVLFRLPDLLQPDWQPTTPPDRALGFWG